MSRMFCESNCELNYQECEKYGLTVIGMPYTQNGVEKFYDMGRDKDAMLQFFRDVKKGDKVVTNALNPQDYINYFEPVFKAGEDILYVHFSCNLSGTFNFMHQALETLHEKYPDRKFTEVDTYNISQGAGLIVYNAAKMHNAGASDEEVVRYVESIRDRVCTFFMVDDLNYLKRGGRVSPTTAFFGSLLGIKPVLSVTKQGKLEKVDIVAGKRRAIDYFMNKIEKLKAEDTFNNPIIVLHADSQPEADELERRIKSKYGEQTVVWNYVIGPTIGTHCGPGTFACIFVGTSKVK